ncbi:DUF1778 domain-containing protein [Candidatus Woesearchaeota archaeon]|nr:DUF1778 domain-containing protein [Candidatus Woesearchaeota archaeon]
MLRKTCLLQLRVTADQKQMIEKLAEINGYNSLSDFIRSRALQSNLIELRLNEIKKMLQKEVGKHD